MSSVTQQSVSPLVEKEIPRETRDKTQTFVTPERESPFPSQNRQEKPEKTSPASPLLANGTTPKASKLKEVAMVRSVEK